MQTFQTEFGEPDRRGRASKVLSHNYKNIKHSNEKNEVGPNDVTVNVKCRQMSNRARSNMEMVKEKMRSTTPSIGLASGLLLWIPGFGGGRNSSRGSMSPRDNKLQQKCNMAGNNESGLISSSSNCFNLFDNSCSMSTELIPRFLYYRQKSLFQF